MVVDNCSTDCTEDIVKKHARTALGSNLRYHKNLANIGGGANFLKCFELAETEWLWVIGDDDLPVDNCMDILSKTIGSHLECQYLNFNSSILKLRTSRTSGFTTSGIEELISSLDCYSNFLFISAGVYKRPAYIRHLPNAYRYIYTYSPQLALIFSVLAEDSLAKCHFSSEFLVRWEAPASHIAWDQQSTNLGLPCVTEAIKSIELRDIFIIKIREVQEIAPSLTLRKILSYRDHDAQLMTVQKQYNILASLTPSYTMHATFASILVLALKQRAVLKIIRLIERASKSKYARIARAGSSLLEMRLLAKDIRKSFLPSHNT